MLRKIDIHRNFYGNITLFVFVFVLLAGTIISEFFRAPEKSNIELDEYRNLFGDEYLETITNITLKNKLGVFRLHKTPDRRKEAWIMEHPRKFPADVNAMRRLISSLRKIKIREIYPNDPIYHANYSLDGALIELELQSIEGETNVVKFGLVNPIDNTTYIYSSKDNAIYHVDELTHSIDSLGITDFIDARIFVLSPDDVNFLAVYRGVKRGVPLFSLRRDENKWLGKRDRELDKQKVSEYLDKLLSIKSLLIFDKTTIELQEVLDRLLLSPTYSVEIEDANKISYSYKVMAINDKLPGLRLEKKKNFIVKASDKNYPYLVDKDFFSTFL